MNLVELDNKIWRLSVEFAKNCTVVKDDERYPVNGLRVIAKHDDEQMSILIISVEENGEDTGMVDVFIEHGDCTLANEDQIQPLCDAIVDHMDAVLTCCEALPNESFMKLINQDPKEFN